MTDFVDIPTAPPRHAKSFRKFGRWFIIAIAFFAPFSIVLVVELLAIAAFICFLGCVISERRIDYPRALLLPFFLLFLILQGISAWLSIVPSTSVFGNLSAPDSLVSFATYFLILFLSFFFFRREGIAKISAAIGTGLLILTGLEGWNFFHSGSLALAASPLSWAVMIAAVLASLAVIRPGEFAGRAKLYFFIAAAIALAALAIFNYQFLWLALAIFIVILAALRFGPREHFQYAFAIIAIALFFALIGSRLPAFPQGDQNIRPGVAASLTAAQGSLRGPAILFGTGPATFTFDFDASRPASMNETSFWMNMFEQGHDFAVTLLATGGLLSFLLFLMIAVLIIQPFLHIQTLDTELAMVASAATFLLVALFLYPGSFAGFVLLFLLLGVAQGAAPRRVISFDTFAPWRSFAASIAIIIFTAIALAGGFFVGEKYLASFFFAQSSQLAAQGNLGTAFSKTDAAIALNPSDEYYRGASTILLSEIQLLANSTSTSASVELPVVIENAVQAATNATAANPRDPENWGNLGSVYETVMPLTTGADVLAEDAYQKAAALDPSDPQWDLDIGRVFLKAGNSASAEDFLNQAIALKDDYADPRVLLVQLYLQEGNVSQAIEKVQELEAQNPLDPGVAFELGYLYYSTNQLSQAAQEFQVATILDPDYANAHYFLGLIDDEQGITAQALSQFQIILALNPGNPQVASIIANIEAGRPALANNVVTSTLSGVQVPASVQKSSH